MYPKVFISHSSSDNAFADKLVYDLGKNKILSWLDKWEIKVGDSIINMIEKGMQDSSYLVVILSAASVKSNWVKEELNAGLMRQLETKKVYVLPVLIEDCEIPLLLKK